MHGYIVTVRSASRRYRFRVIAQHWADVANIIVDRFGIGAAFSARSIRIAGRPA